MKTRRTFNGILLCMATLLAACGNQAKLMEASKSKSLVIFYSQTGATKQVADILAEQVGADMDSIEAVNPYNGSFEQTVSRCQDEMSKNILPEIKPIRRDIANYDTLFIGSPIWFGTIAPPVSAYIKSVDLKGKVVVPFVTFGSGGLQAATIALKEAQPGATFLDGYGVRNLRIGKAKAEIETFLIRSGIAVGALDEEQPFSDQKPMTDADKEIFDKACGDYPMPLGTPLTVGSRAIPDGTEYIFEVESKDAQGKPVKALVYVTASNKEGEAPEFTQVVR
ncbi:MAG: NAD(P)H-dependent oxidoreductase [Bacteroidaceae bacterium]|nr:NAD(P)H-dependent oxidoreductase [Bacteroidaceae bacterium]